MTQDLPEIFLKAETFVHIYSIIFNICCTSVFHLCAVGRRFSIELLHCIFLTFHSLKGQFTKISQKYIFFLRPVVLFDHLGCLSVSFQDIVHGVVCLFALLKSQQQSIFLEIMNRILKIETQILL